MNKKPLVSIIIPNFETPFEDFLLCMNSISEQTYSNWECVIIDDGSSTEYKKQYELFSENSSIRIIEKKNEGPSAARNTGIRESTGDLVCFCDADDLLKPDFLSEAVDSVLQHDLDLFVGGTEVLVGNEVSLVHKSNTEGLRIVDFTQRDELIDFTLAAQSTNKTSYLGNILLGRVYPKLMSYDLVEKVLFDKSISIHEDNLWSIEIFEFANRIGISDQIYYSYKINPYSITHKSYKKSNLTKEIKFAEIVIQRYFEQYPNATKVRLLNVFIGIVNILSVLKLDSDETKKYLKDILIIFQSMNIDFNSLKSFNLSKYKSIIITILNLKNISLKILLFNLLIYYKRLK